MTTYPAHHNIIEIPDVEYKYPQANTIMRLTLDPETEKPQLSFYRYREGQRTYPDSGLYQELIPDVPLPTPFATLRIHDAVLETSEGPTDLVRLYLTLSESLIFMSNKQKEYLAKLEGWDNMIAEHEYQISNPASLARTDHQEEPAPAQ